MYKLTEFDLEVVVRFLKSGSNEDELIYTYHVCYEGGGVLIRHGGVLVADYGNNDYSWINIRSGISQEHLNKLLPYCQMLNNFIVSRNKTNISTIEFRNKSKQYLNKH